MTARNAPPMPTKRVDDAMQRARNRRATARAAGLAPTAVQLLRECAQLLAARNVAGAENAWLRASLLAPAHPETRRWSAEVALARGDAALARTEAEAAIAARANDAALFSLLARACLAAGDERAADAALVAAATAARDADEHLDAGIELDARGDAAGALAAAERAIALEPGLSRARLLRVRALGTLGRGADAAAECRALIARGELVAEAWWSLLDLKTERVSADEVDMLARAASVASAPRARMLLEFALGQACEQHRRLDAAFAAFARANAAMRATRPWDAGARRAHVRAVRDAFAARVSAADASQGEGILFVVGMPRSGTSLVEQVLAAHPEVAGASELPFLPHVIEEESQRRGVAWPGWAGDATPADWSRLGARYLALSARFRVERPRMTDKLPMNWLLAGAALAMLPGARVLVCRRDPLETCWSCFKQLFDHASADFAYDVASLAAYWADAEALGDWWAARDPARVRVIGHERLLAEPQAEIRALLAFCGLEFAESCLRFHEAQRPVRSASATQVREPLRRTTARTAEYGALLDPLRAALAQEAERLARQPS